MSNSDDINLKETFHVLDRKLREQTPSFDTMRSNALQIAGARKSTKMAPISGHRTWLVAACGGLSLLVIMLSMDWIRSSRETAMFQPVPETHSDPIPVPRQEVDQLLAAIERHFEVNQAVYAPFYLTDELLAPLDFGITL